jgi:hypothetical protein
MKSILDPLPPDDHKYLDHPRELNLYEHLTTFDLLLSVEHCYRCEYHPMTLRHQSQEYVTHADSILKSMAAFIHSKVPCARLGVIRFPIHSLECKKTSREFMEEKNRVGACEVQIAFRSLSGDICFALLHSKLKSRKWPSTTQLENRIEHFLHRNNIDFVENPRDFSYEETKSSAMGVYPVGVGPWEEVPLSRLSWRYSWNDDLPQNIDSVQWVFDSKSFGHNPRFSDGALVRAYFLLNKWGGREKYSTSCTVNNSFKDTAANLNMVRLRPWYCSEADPSIDALEENCVSLSEHDEHPPPSSIGSCVEGQLPDCLFLLMYVSVDLRLIDVSEGDDDEYEDCFEDTPLSQDILFQSRRLLHSQLSRLVWKCLQSKAGKEHGTMQHPLHWNLDVDIQLCYCEAMILWIQNFFSDLGSPITVKHLANWVLSSPKYRSMKSEQRRKEKRKSIQVCEPVPKESVFRMERGEGLIQSSIDEILYDRSETREYEEEVFEEIEEEELKLEVGLEDHVTVSSVHPRP